MHTVSIRTLAALACGRSEELGAALTATPQLVMELAAARRATPLTCERPELRAPAPTGARRWMLARIPEWFSADDPVPGGSVIHGEPV